VGLAACGGKAITDGDGGAGTSPAPTGSSAPPPVTTGPDPSSSPFDMCGQLSSRCSGNSLDGVCAQEKQCFDNVLRAGVALPLEQCIVNACTTDGFSRCVAQAAAPYATEKDFLAYNDACQSKTRSCGLSGTSYCDPTIAMIRPLVLTAMQACFDQPCPQVESCENGVLAQNGCPLAK
jgi:hypothetical protein